MDVKETLERDIPNRLYAVEMCGVALELNSGFEEPQAMQILLNGKLRFEGLSTGFTNPVIEVGVIHGRSLLEFLGLQMTKGQLGEISGKRRPTDAGVEQLENSHGPLQRASLNRVLSMYPGDRAEAEQALCSVFHAANKGVAHMTLLYAQKQDQAHLLRIACKGIPALIQNLVFTPMGLPMPNNGLSSRQAR